MVEAVAHRLGGLPIVDGDRVIFLVQGDPAHPPRIVGDLNGWGAHGDSTDASAGRMSRLGASRWFELQATAAPASRLEYLVVTDDRPALDAGNPNHLPGVGGEVSELRLPGCRTVPGVDDSSGATVPKGTLHSEAFTAHDGTTRRLTWYTPSGYEAWAALGAGADDRVAAASAGGAPAGLAATQTALPIGSTPGAPLPLVLFHDGDLMLGAGRVPALLDRLIATGRVAPLLAVFVEPADRASDYALDPTWRALFLDELLPYLDRRLNVARDAAHRAVVGVSRGAVGALDLARFAEARFGSCGLLIPAYRPVPLPAALAERALPGLRADLVLARYDARWLDDGRQLAATLRAAGAAVTVVEVPEGHATETWRRALPDVLMRFAPGPQAGSP